MTIIQNLVNEINLSKNHKTSNVVLEEKPLLSNIEQRIATLKIESEIPLFKAKLLTLQHETQILVGNQELDLEVKEKQMDKIIKKSKKLFLEMVSFIFSNPLKEKEFTINNNNGVITLHGNLGYLFDYFSSQYGVDIEKSSKRLLDKNKNSLFFNNQTTQKEFIETYNKNYYMLNHENSLI